MPFQPGQSGNPSGRPKEDPEVKRLAKQNCVAAIERLVALMDDADPRVCVAACKEILDRGLGKPTQSIEKSVEHRFVARLPQRSTIVEQWTQQNKLTQNQS